MGIQLIDFDAKNLKSHLSLPNRDNMDSILGMAKALHEEEGSMLSKDGHAQSAYMDKIQKLVLRTFSSYLEKIKLLNQGGADEMKADLIWPPNTTGRILFRGVSVTLPKFEIAPIGSQRPNEIIPKLKFYFNFKDSGSINVATFLKMRGDDSMSELIHLAALHMNLVRVKPRKIVFRQDSPQKILGERYRIADIESIGPLLETICLIYRIYHEDLEELHELRESIKIHPALANAAESIYWHKVAKMAM